MLLNVALVGLGRISLTHINAISNLPLKFNLTAVCSSKSKNAIQTYCQDKNVKSLSFDECLKSKDIHVIVLCTPNNLHFNQAQKALKAGKYVIVEKPLCLSVSQAKKLLPFDDKLFIVLQNRYNNAIWSLKQLIQSKQIGDIYSFSCNLFWHRGHEYFAKGGWRGKLHEDGLLLNQAYHYLDIIIWLFGIPEHLLARLQFNNSFISAEDTAVANLMYKHTAGTLNASISAFAKDREGGITVNASNAYIKIAGMALNAVDVWDTKSNIAPAPVSEVITNVYGNGHVKFYEDVWQAVCMHKSSLQLAKVSDGLAVARLIQSMHQSHNLGACCKVLA